jgi:hypothetical protein
LKHITDKKLTPILAITNTLSFDVSSKHSFEHPLPAKDVLTNYYAYPGAWFARVHVKMEVSYEVWHFLWT